MKCITFVLLLFIPFFGFSQDVLHKNGWSHYIGTEKVSRKEFKQELAHNSDAFRKFNRARTMGYVSIGFGVGITALAFTDADENWTGERVNLELIGLTAATLFGILATMEENSAIRRYNNDLNPSTRIAPTSNGIGLVYTF